LVSGTAARLHAESPHHKNDNAHVEQKNWTHVRKIFGWRRFDSHEAVAAMNAFYANALRLLLNYFQARVKLVEKLRVGSRIVGRYDRPMTPLDRLIARQLVDDQTATALLAHRKSLDPLALIASIERKVAEVFGLPTSPWRSPRKGRLLLGSFTSRALKRDQDFKNAPVRSYVARR
jgi:hypothetical protein